VLSLTISDPNLFSVPFSGPYVPSFLFASLVSLTGQIIDDGDLLGNGDAMEIFFGPAETGFTVNAAAGGNDVPNIIQGTWSPLAAVPEPASAVQAGIACTISLALAAFSKRKEAWRQRPVGQLEANQ
jgi:hypothetical protein